MRYSRLAKAQENLVTHRTVLGECQSPVMQHSYSVPGGNIFFRNFVTYVLELNITEKRHI